MKIGWIFMKISIDINIKSQNVFIIHENMFLNPYQY